MRDYETIAVAAIGALGIWGAHQKGKLEGYNCGLQQARQEAFSAVQARDAEIAGLKRIVADQAKALANRFWTATLPIWPTDPDTSQNGGVSN